MKVKILYGLPGSGKTTWANNQRNAVIIDCDSMDEYSPEKVANKIRLDEYEDIIDFDDLDTVAIEETVYIDGLEEDE